MAMSLRLKGFIAVTLIGAAWHFVFQLAGEARWVGAIAPVNESFMEHMKLGYWGLLLFSLYDRKFYRGNNNSYFLSKLLALLMISTVITLVFFGYRLFTTGVLVPVDIASFVAGVWLAHWVFHRTVAAVIPVWVNRLSLAFFLFVGVAMAWCTYYPPEWPVFMDSRNHTYGIIHEMHK